MKSGSSGWKSSRPLLQLLISRDQRFANTLQVLVLVQMLVSFIFCGCKHSARGAVGRWRRGRRRASRRARSVSQRAAACAARARGPLCALLEPLLALRRRLPAHCGPASRRATPSDAIARAPPVLWLVIALFSFYSTTSLFRLLLYRCYHL